MPWRASRLLRRMQNLAHDADEALCECYTSHQSWCAVGSAVLLFRFKPSHV
jgi:hypothetical protein